MQELPPQNSLLAFALQPIPNSHQQASKVWILGLAVVFIMGIVCGLNGLLALEGTTLLLLASALFLELTCQHFFSKHLPTLTSALLLLFVFALGVERSTQTYVYIHQPTPPPHKLRALVILTAAGTSTQATSSYPAQLIATVENNKLTRYNLRGKLIFLNSDSVTQHLRTGNKLLATIDFAQETGRNPNAFDNLNWQRQRGELFGGRVEPNSVHVLGIDSSIGPSVQSELRARIIERFQRAGINGEALELVKAMSIGARETLPNRVRDHFSRSGIAHLLALSGLHVGFIYALFAFLFRFIGIDKRYKRILREGIPLLATWGFVLLAGASPSLLRATIMLSIWGASRVFFMRWQSIDVLALAALLILWLSPAALYDLGFQLSFCALLGIVLIYPRMQTATRSRYKVLAWGKQILGVSLSAQLGTLPITLHYFGTLPLLSLLTNIVAIPLAALIVPLALVIGFLPTGSFLSHIGGFVLQYCANSLLWISEQIASFPWATLTGLRIPTYLAWLLAIIIVFIGVFSPFRRRKHIITLFALLIALFGGVLFEIVEAAKSREVVIYTQHYGTALSVRNGREIQGVYLQNRSAAIHNIEVYAEGIWGARIQIDSVTISNILSPTEYGFSANTPLRIAIPTGKSPSEKLVEPIPTDILLLTHACKWEVTELITHFTANKVVIDGSYPRWRLEKTLLELKQQKLDVHSTRNEGAWVWRAQTKVAPTFYRLVALPKNFR